MADDLDPPLEARLRVALHVGADALPLLVREEDVLRARRRRWARPLGFAGALVGAAAVLAMLLGTGVLRAPGPEGGAAPSSSSASLHPLASYLDLEKLLPSGDTPVLRGERTDPTDPGASMSDIDLGRIPAGVRLDYAIHCLGGAIDIIVRHGDEVLGTHTVNCSLQPGLARDVDPTLFGHPPFDGTEHVIVRAPAGIRWRVVVAATTEPGPSFIQVGPSPSPSGR